MRTPGTRTVANLRSGRGQKLLCAATAASAIPLGVEVYVNHYSGSFANKWMWAPVGLLPHSERLASPGYAPNARRAPPSRPPRS